MISSYVSSFLKKEIRDYESRVISGIVLFSYSTADAKREAKKILQKFYEEKVIRV